MGELATSAGWKHVCLPASTAGSRALAAARLTDRQRLGLLLQGVALLAHLERAGWHLPAGWDEARVAGGDRLVLSGVQPGRGPRAVHDLLLLLVAQLFGSSESISGRGEVRYALRRLLDRWRQTLLPLPAEAAVVQLLAGIPQLWKPIFGECRKALAAEHPGEEGCPRRWVLGPRAFRQRLLARPGSHAELEALLAGEEIRTFWPQEAASGDPLARAAQRFQAGRFEAARSELAGARSAAATALRLRCQVQLGELGSARRALLRLQTAGLPPAVVLDIAEAAVRIFANRGDTSRLREWVHRALRAGQGELTPRAELLAAEAAWDQGDLEQLGERLEAARGALADPARAWRWYQAKGLLAMEAADGPRVVENLTRALQSSRRRLARHEAAGLWNDLGIGRAQADDLGGAERAFAHALRLFNRCDGPRRTTLAATNLAEARLRRGHLAGVREILERSTAENRLAGNFRGTVQDAELWARYELTLGRAEAALTTCQRTLAQLDEQGSDWRRAELWTLAARAWGWLGRAPEAAAALGRTTAAARSTVEPEERPALLAHAGDREGALREAEATPWKVFWQAALSGRPCPPLSDRELAVLGPARVARLAYDLELAAPGTVPAPWRRTAIATLRRLGADRLAERLELRDEGPWQAVAAYLSRAEKDPEAAARLLAEAGYPQAALAWEGEAAGSWGGGGGGRILEAELPQGKLILRSPEIDAPLRALFALVGRDAESWREEPPAGPPGSLGGMVGESPELRRAVAAVARLAAGDFPVLIGGESGTGKELVAQWIQRASRRSSRPWLTLNCAALSETLLLSDLFGHVRGAFTGADRDRAGVFEAAQGGTVFLDEIGDLPPVAQGMLLRVLEEGEIRRVGESLSRRVDVRVLAATHRSLPAMVAAGSFRQDLFYRLRVGFVELPPLRDRGRDVLLLADHFLRREKTAVRLSSAAQGSLLRHRWPGNVRELRNVLAVAAALAAEEGWIRPEHLGLPQGSGPAERDAEPADSYHRQVDALRRRLVVEALAACGGNQAEAARRLGLSRQALSYLVRQLEILEDPSARR